MSPAARIRPHAHAVFDRGSGSGAGGKRVSADPYRIRPPSALQKVAGTLDTMVRICVNTSGGVSAVSVLKSADPALDRQISATVPRWRYRPLQDQGAAVPFCYTTRMRFVGG